MRMHDSITPHPLSASCPLQWYFVGKFKFSAELMVSYFYLVIAADLCFPTTPSMHGTDHDLMALDSRCTGLPIALLSL